MKKIVLLIFILISIGANAQRLDTVSVSLTLRAGDWAWAVGKYNGLQDSATRARIRGIRTAVIAANPANWNTNVTVNNLSGHVVILIYRMYLQATVGEYVNMGATTAERNTIYTNIRALSNSAVQYFIGQADGEALNYFNNVRNSGKNIILDN